jgi:hypothetical protein
MFAGLFWLDRRGWIHCRATPLEPQRGHRTHTADGAVIRWCFADAETAAAFPPDGDVATTTSKAKRKILNNRRHKPDAIAIHVACVRGASRSNRSSYSPGNIHRHRSHRKTRTHSDGGDGDGHDDRRHASSYHCTSVHGCKFRTTGLSADRMAQTCCRQKIGVLRMDWTAHLRFRASQVLPPCWGQHCRHHRVRRLPWPRHPRRHRRRHHLRVRHHVEQRQHQEPAVKKQMRRWRLIR